MCTVDGVTPMETNDNERSKYVGLLPEVPKYALTFWGCSMWVF